MGQYRNSYLVGWSVCITDPDRAIAEIEAGKARTLIALGTTNERVRIKDIIGETKVIGVDAWAACRSIMERIDALPDPVERCEAGCDAPVTHYDDEGVPLCEECWKILEAEAEAQKLSEKATATGRTLGRTIERQRTLEIIGEFRKSGQEPTETTSATTSSSASTRNRSTYGSSAGLKRS